MEALEQARAARDKQSPRHSRHQREAQRHFHTTHSLQFPDVPRPKPGQLAPLEHGRKRAFATEAAAVMWQHRNATLKR
jgi:hypothetical protein